MHRVAQRLRVVQLLHPDRGASPERIDAVVVRRGDIAQDRPPEAHIDRVRLRRDCKLDLLEHSRIGGGALLPSDCGDRSGELCVVSLEQPHVPREPHGQRRTRYGEDGTRFLDAWDARDRFGKPRRFTQRRDAEGGRRAAVEDCPVVRAVGREERPPARFAHPVASRGAGATFGLTWNTLSGSHSRFRAARRASFASP